LRLNGDATAAEKERKKEARDASTKVSKAGLKNSQIDNQRERDRPCANFDQCY